MSSQAWLMVVIAAGMVLALANLQYQRTRDEEREIASLRRQDARDAAAQAKEEARDAQARAERLDHEQQLATEVRNFLRPELEVNSVLVARVIALAKKNEIPLQRFDSSAWETVKGGELVRGISAPDLAMLALAYAQGAAANRLLDQLVELMVGSGAALDSAQGNRKKFMAELTDLAPHLAENLKHAEAVCAEPQAAK